MKSVAILVESYSQNPNHHQIQVKNFENQEEVYLTTEIKDGVLGDAFRDFLIGLKEEGFEIRTAYVPLWLSKIFQKEIGQVFSNFQLITDYNVINP